MGVHDYSTTSSENTVIGSLPVTNNTAADQIDDIIRLLMADIKASVLDTGGELAAGGTANALTLTTTSTIPALADGVMVAFRATATNTGAATINVDAKGVKAIRNPGDLALSGGEIVTGGHYVIQYNEAANSGAGAWMLLNPNTFSEAGSFTPTFTFGTPGDLSVAYVTQTGTYVRVGRLVYIFIDMRFTPTYTTSTGSAVITSLPYASDGGNHLLNFRSHATALTYPTNRVWLTAEFGAATQIRLLGQASGTVPTLFATSEFGSGGEKGVRISGCYRTA